MLPNMNPAQMKKMMSQLGIKSSEIPAEKVVIEKSDGSKLIIESPQVTIIEMQGQKSFQISGKVSESSGSNNDDTQIVAEQANVSKEKAAAVLKETNGDIAEAIMRLKHE